MRKIKILFTCTISLLLCSCNGFFEKDNTPTPASLVRFTPETKIHNLWYTSTGFGVGSDYLKLNPAISGDTIVAANKNGYMVAVDKRTGKKRWSVDTKLPISGGPTTKDGLVFVGTREGEVVAIDQHTGKTLWKNNLSSEILASPAAGNGIVVVKSIDGRVTAFSENDGHKLWSYQQTEPTLILRGSSAPQISHDSVIVGFANGNLTKLSLRNGNPSWQEMMATPQGTFAIERMIDIDANPIVYDNRIYAATYQGRISALNLSSGKPVWSHDISSYTGLAADNGHVFVTDAKSHVWGFNANSGLVDWRQTELNARNITGPVAMGNYIVVGDEEGYLHWLNKQDGQFAARARVAGFGVLATPVVDETDTLYVITKDGHLAAYTLG